MNEGMLGKSILRLTLAIIVSTALTVCSYAQIIDTLHGKNLYRPPAKEIMDSFAIQRHIQDSIIAREHFVRDSLLAREKFVQDSIARRQQMLDSLTFLQKELPDLLKAYSMATGEDIILKDNKILIVGDSVLSDYSYLILPFSVSDPYTPWKIKWDLNDKTIKIRVDRLANKITAMQAPFMKCSFTYGNRNNILVLTEQAAVQNNYNGHFYKIPCDSIFYDNYKRIIKIKRYVQFFSVNSSNQKGSPLFTNLALVKQFTYAQGNQVSQYQVVKFCDRWNAYTANKVCSIITYSISGQGSTYQMTRRNDPANSYSDGTYAYEFDAQDNLKSISFHNLANTENWQRSIEINTDGNVSCYIDKANNVERQSICMIYHLKEPNAKYPVEIITTTFEDDGISYFQKNNTTGQSRTRDRMTLEWSSWQ